MIIINIFCLALISLIVWWFWLYKPGQVITSGTEQRIEVAHGIYKPSHITVAAHKPITLNFFREDASPCSETVIFPDLDISAQLGKGALTPVELPPLEPGSYAFQCQMKMYTGILTVE